MDWDAEIGPGEPEWLGDDDSDAEGPLGCLQITVGADPGGSGGIAWTKPGIGVVAQKMPDDFAGIAALAHEIHRAANVNPFGRYDAPASLPVVVYCEAVTGYVAPPPGTRKCPACGQEPIRQTGSAMFTFGKNAGALEMAFAMIGARVVMVPAKQWQSPLFIKRKGRPKDEWKRDLKDAAQRRFPGIKVTLATADALLILSYAMLKEGAGAVICPGNPQTGRGEAPARKKRIAKCPSALSEALKLEESRRAVAGSCFVKNESAELAGERGPAGELGQCEDIGEDAPPPSRHGLSVGEWKGVLWVFRPAIGESGTETIIRRASAVDIRTLPARVPPSATVNPS